MHRMQGKKKFMMLLKNLWRDEILGRWKSRSGIRNELDFPRRYQLNNKHCLLYHNFEHLTIDAIGETRFYYQASLNRHAFQNCFIPTIQIEASNDSLEEYSSDDDVAAINMFKDPTIKLQAARRCCSSYFFFQFPLELPDAANNEDRNRSVHHRLSTLSSWKFPAQQRPWEGIAGGCDGNSLLLFVMGKKGIIKLCCVWWWADGR